MFANIYLNFLYLSDYSGMCNLDICRLSLNLNYSHIYCWKIQRHLGKKNLRQMKKRFIVVILIKTFNIINIFIKNIKIAYIPSKQNLFLLFNFSHLIYYEVLSKNKTDYFILLLTLFTLRKLNTIVDGNDLIITTLHPSLLICPIFINK